MNLLAIDTSADACSVALLCGEQLSGHCRVEPRGHTRLIMPMIRQLLAEQGVAVDELTVLAFAAGPGSFTGLRIATGTIQGLAWGLDIPVVPVSTLAAVALDAFDKATAVEGDCVAVAFDARMDEVYWGCYRLEGGFPVALAPERVCAPEQVDLPPDQQPSPQTWLAAGGGWRYADRIPESVCDRVTPVADTDVPDARCVARLAQQIYQSQGGVAAAEAQPVYLRDEVTWQKLPGR